MTLLRPSRTERRRPSPSGRGGAGPDWQPPHLITNPGRDDAFRRTALEAVRSWTTVERLESELRARYPRARVHERLLSAEPFVVWYVYRDGRWAASGPEPVATRSR
jgi:hypothetical protein